MFIVDTAPFSKLSKQIKWNELKHNFTQELATNTPGYMGLYITGVVEKYQPK